MLQAIKENKVYHISEADQKLYNEMGYDIYSLDGRLIEYSAKKTVPYAEYAKVLKELKELKASTAKKTASSK